MKFKLQRVLNDIIDMIYPRVARCIACERDCETYNRYGFCHTCFETLPFIESPRCSVCGRHSPDGNICNSCLDADHIFTQAISVFEYMPPISDIIHRFKYEGYTDLAEPIAMLMTDVVEQMDWKIDSIIPVPLHVKRLELRGYNQASYIAHSMGKLMQGIEVLDTVLVRQRNTPSQIGMDRAGRMWNLYNAFKVRNGSLLEGKSILLIDDVLTTGSTVDNCSRALLEAGAENIYVSTFASSVLEHI